jgi:hypothetical protein
MRLRDMLNPLSIRVALLGSLLLAGSAPAILSQAMVIRDITWERGQPLRNPIKYNAYGVIGDRIMPRRSRLMSDSRLSTIASTKRQCQEE